MALRRFCPSNFHERWKVIRAKTVENWDPKTHRKSFFPSKKFRAFFATKGQGRFGSIHSFWGRVILNFRGGGGRFCFIDSNKTLLLIKIYAKNTWMFCIEKKLFEMVVWLCSTTVKSKKHLWTIQVNGPEKKILCVKLELLDQGCKNQLMWAVIKIHTGHSMEKLVGWWGSLWWLIFVPIYLGSLWSSI